VKLANISLAYDNTKKSKIKMNTGTLVRTYQISYAHY